MSNNKKLRFADWSLGSKISVFTFGLVGLILAALVLTISSSTATLLEERANQNMHNDLDGVVNTVALFNKTVTTEVQSFSKVFAAEFNGSFALDTEHTTDIDGKAVPTLSHNGKVVNLAFAETDRFSVQTGGNATVFARSGNEFIRVTTSVKKEDGSRAVGTELVHTSPAYAALRDGKPYIGLAKLFGKQYITQYQPVRDGAGEVVGALYVGIDINADIAALRERIHSIKVGQTGYVYVLNAAAGPQFGELLVHPDGEGKNILDSRAADGRAFIKEILEQKTGDIAYRWKNQGETQAREKFAAFAWFKEWDWVIVGGTYRDEITAEAGTLRNRFIGFGLIALLLFAVALYAVVRTIVTRPLTEARDAAERIANGDLTVNISVRNHDEIGALLEAMNGISSKLSGVVGQVRDGAEQIANAAQEISTGNLDLCSRTERQADSLASTSASMEQLTQTVRQNAEHARQANSMALSASNIAEKGGAMVSRVITTMDSIKRSSTKISDITSVIDGIAFQTNILALNAAVEAARAGEQGRGFAVVASEVRNLAQRSASAAKEIKGLIATSSDEVDTGSQLVQDAGSTMNDIVSAVGQVTDFMADITAASTEQTSGIELVNSAICEMDDSTRHNAALVEEASAAAQALQDQAEVLARAVRLFRLEK